MTPQMLSEVLLKAGLLDREEFEIAERENCAHPGERLTQTLVRLGYAAEQDIVLALASHLHVPYVDLGRERLDKEVIRRIPAKLARSSRMVPVSMHGSRLLLAMEDPLDSHAVEMARFTSGLHVLAIMAAPRDIEAALGRYYPMEELPAEPSGVDVAGVLAQGNEGPSKPFVPPETAP
jgi:hypothetical protein